MLHKKFACVTGDVHQRLHSCGYMNEVVFLREYVNIVDQFNAKATIFVTGKCIDENIKYFQSLAKKKNIELGGHTYSAFRPLWLHKLFYICFGSQYGPKFYKRRDIAKTVNAFRKIGISLVVWRTHGYEGDEVSYSLLKNFGVRLISDKVGLFEDWQIRMENSLIHIPITLPPDDIIYHALCGKIKDRDKIYKWRNNFHSIFYRDIAEGKNIILQFHPLIQGLMDGFKMFSGVLRYLKKREYNFLTLTEYAEIQSSRSRQ